MGNVFLKKSIARYEGLSAPVKAALWFTICNILQKGISMIVVPVFTRILTTEQFGVYSVYQSWYSIITVFATLNLYYGVFNNGMVKYPEKRNEFTSSVQGLTTTLTFCLLIVYICAVDFWNGVLGLPTLLVLAMFVELFFAPAFSFWAARQRFEYKYKALVAITIILSLGSPILGVVAVLNTPYKAEARILSFVFVQACIGGALYVYNLAKGRRFFQKEYWKFALAFNLPLVPHYLSQSVLQQSDRIMISNMVGTGEAAIYSVAYSVSTLMVLVTSAINNSFIPYTYGCIKERKFDDLRKNTNALVALVGLGTFFVVAFGPEVIRIFAPVEYYDAIWIIPPVSASVFFMFLYPIFGNVEFYFEENKFVMMASVTGAVANIVLNYFCIPVFGYVAAGYTTLFCYVLFSGGHYFFMKKVLKKHLPGAVPYDMRFVMSFSVFMLIAMGAMLMLYRHIVLRYSIIALMLVLVFWKRKAMINIFKTIKK